MRLPVLPSGEGNSGCGCGDDGGTPAAPQRRGVTRRSFLRQSAAVGGGLAALAAAASPLRELLDQDVDFGDFFQKHYKEMTPEEMDKALERIRASVDRQYGVEANVEDIRPMDGVEFVYAVNLTRCNGNRRCVHACVAENNQSRDPEMQYIRVIEMPKGTFNLEEGNHHYEGTVPDPNSYYLPVQCHQCSNPPCTKVCPVEATWTEPDGITVVDYDWCIGCRYCEAACPYWARRFNFTDPEIPADRLNPDMSYLSNRPRPRGTMEKCTFCLHRTRRGRLPACLEACPTGARKFGNILDPTSEIAEILRTKRVFVLKEEANTRPRFFYYFDERYPRGAASELGQMTAEPGPGRGEGGAS